jgi:hypothetical protein
LVKASLQRLRASPTVTDVFLNQGSVFRHRCSGRGRR